MEHVTLEQKSHVVVFTDPLLVTAGRETSKREERGGVTSLTGILLSCHPVSTVFFHQLSIFMIRGARKGSISVERETYVIVL